MLDNWMGIVTITFSFYFGCLLYTCCLGMLRMWRLHKFQGLNIFRFANRIPLLFEQGGDVVTRTALKRIRLDVLPAIPLLFLGTGMLAYIAIKLSWEAMEDWNKASNSNIIFSWSSYKINQTQDKIGVFVSIVSTKIPFKGTGKEYIGDDISEIASAVKVGKFFALLHPNFHYEYNE